MIAAKHRSNPAVELLGQIGKADRGVILKSHGREAHDIRLEIPQDLQERGTACLRQTTMSATLTSWLSI